jgi:hypothetical protein
VIDLGFPGAIIQPKYNQSWPDFRSRPDAVRVRFVAGYAAVVNGGLDGTVPRPIVEYMLNWISNRFENRETPKASDETLIAPFRVGWF